MLGMLKAEPSLGMTVMLRRWPTFLANKGEGCRIGMNKTPFGVAPYATVYSSYSPDCFCSCGPYYFRRNESLLRDCWLRWRRRKHCGNHSDRYDPDAANFSESGPYTNTHANSYSDTYATTRGEAVYSAGPWDVAGIYLE
jgi:hypothetical protein